MRRWLLVGVLLLGVLVAYQWYGVPAQETSRLRTSLDRRPPMASESPLLPGIEPLPDVGFYQPVVERPLFNQDRAPAAEEPAAEVESEAVSGIEFKLKGIVLTPNGRVALIEEKDGVARRLREQESYRGWVVDAVDPEKIVLEQDGEREEVPLRRYAKVLPGNAPAAARTGPAQSTEKKVPKKGKTLQQGGQGKAE